MKLSHLILCIRRIVEKYSKYSKLQKFNYGKRKRAILLNTRVLYEYTVY